jgi:hypothetical protein
MAACDKKLAAIFGGIAAGNGPLRADVLLTAPLTAPPNENDGVQFFDDRSAQHARRQASTNFAISDARSPDYLRGSFQKPYKRVIAALFSSR